MPNISKAFDKVLHQHIILEFYCITGGTLVWLAGFLLDCSQQVALNGILCSSCKVTSGVLQGSILSPTHFLVHINDIANNVECQLRLFVDDIIIYKIINSPEDHTILQEDINHLCKWAHIS